MLGSCMMVLAARTLAGPRIAIVGGGASGTLTAVQLLRCAAAQQLPVRVTLIDRHGRHGLGLAYSTTRPVAPDERHGRAAQRAAR